MTQIIAGGLWFKKHCLKITPQTKGGTVRYRYPGEDWITVSGDDYKITDERKGQCAGANYDVSATNTELFADGNVFNERSLIGGIVWNVRKILNPSAPFTFREQDNLIPGLYRQAVFEYEDMNGNVREFISYSSGATVGYVGGQVSNLDIYRVNSQGGRWFNESYCGFCMLTIYRNGAIVLKVENDVCPEVEVIGNECVIGVSEKKEVETTPLGNIFVSVTHFNRNGTQAQDMPPECIAIYNQIPYLPLGSSPTFGTNGQTAQIMQFIGEWCSSEGCNRPEVIRLGDNCKENCPNGTCPIVCGESVCCADPNTGQIVQEIPLNEYGGSEI